MPWSNPLMRHRHTLFEMLLPQRFVYSAACPCRAIVRLPREDVESRDDASARGGHQHSLTLLVNGAARGSLFDVARCVPGVDICPDLPTPTARVVHEHINRTGGPKSGIFQGSCSALC